MALPSAPTPPKQSLSDLTIFIHGAPKAGKSGWCSHATTPLFLATEAGLNHLNVHQVPIATWDEMLAACAEIAQGKHPFKTVVIDTADNAYRMCTRYILDQQKITHESDLGYGKAYAMIQAEFYRVINKLALLPYGLILVSHSEAKEFDTRTGKITRMVPTLPDKARRMLMGMVDVILYFDLERQTKSTGEIVFERSIRTKPSVYYDAGDRTGRLPETIEPTWDAFVAAYQIAVATASAGRPVGTTTATDAPTNGAKTQKPTAQQAPSKQPPATQTTTAAPTAA